MYHSAGGGLGVHKTLPKDHRKAEKKYHVDEEQIGAYWKFIVREGRNHKFQVFKKGKNSFFPISDIISIEEVEPKYRGYG